MPQYRVGVVRSMISELPGIQRVRVEIDGDDQRAYNLPNLTGFVAVGDSIMVNTTAVELGLGTGGWHVIHANLTRPTVGHRGPGHIMKMRYTSLQADVGSYEEHHPELPSSLDGTPVVVCSLHSQMGVVAATFGELAPRKRLVYVMTDGAALPLALSDLVRDLVSKDLLAATVTAGHAFGGDAEAVNVPSALCIARHAFRADAIVVAMGPGVVGTGSELGTTAIEVGPALDAARVLGGRPIVCVRSSSADNRDRHRGVSHHTHTSLRFCQGAEVAWPKNPEQPIAEVPAFDGHTVAHVTTPDVAAVLTGFGLRITTMGRTVNQDRLFFDMAAAAGARAAEVLR